MDLTRLVLKLNFTHKVCDTNIRILSISLCCLIVQILTNGYRHTYIEYNSESTSLYTHREYRYTSKTVM
uniref:Uncharacterized protein n=1 Tax=Pararge aegeria TaxID=116150 RepID=S4P3Q1_9NEOP